MAGERDRSSDDWRGVAIVKLMGQTGKRRRNSVNHDERLLEGCSEGMRMKDPGNSRGKVERSTNESSAVAEDDLHILSTRRTSVPR